MCVHPGSPSSASPLSSIAPDNVAITLRPSGIRGACVKVVPCEKTPACSQWPRTGGGVSGALQLTLCLESTTVPSGRTEAHTYRLGCWFHWKAGWRCRLVPLGGKEQAQVVLRSRSSITEKRHHAWLLLTLWCYLGKNRFELTFSVIIQLRENSVVVSL